MLFKYKGMTPVKPYSLRQTIVISYASALIFLHTIMKKQQNYFVYYTCSKRQIISGLRVHVNELRRKLSGRSLLRYQVYVDTSGPIRLCICLGDVLQNF